MGHFLFYLFVFNLNSLIIFHVIIFTTFLPVIKYCQYFLGRRESLESSSSKDTSLSGNQVSQFKFSKLDRDSTGTAKMGYGRSPLLSSRSAWSDQVCWPRKESMEHVYENASV